MTHKAFRTSRRNRYFLLVKRTERIRRLWKKHVKGYKVELAKSVNKFNPKVAALHAIHANALRREAQERFGVTFGFEFKVPILNGIYDKM
jgi:hypothetical protein